MKSRSEVSIVIPTFNRPKDLSELLRSILAQAIQPSEVIVVDDSDNLETEKMISEMNKDFIRKGIALIYTKGGDIKGRSITRAKNVGAAESTGEIIFFIDDDIILDKDYVKEILKVYEKHPNALGVAGHLKGFLSFVRISGVRWLFSNSLNKIFFMDHGEEVRCRILPSGAFTYPYNINEEIQCQWFSGTNMSFKSYLLRKFRFDENLKKYALCEDMDFSYRIYKSIPGSLYMTPKAKLAHKFSLAARENPQSLIYKGNIYHAYFFQKNIRQTPLNKIIFVWNAFGDLITTILNMPRETVYCLKVQLLILKHWKKLKEEVKTF